MRLSAAAATHTSTAAGGAPPKRTTQPTRTGAMSARRIRQGLWGLVRSPACAPTRLGREPRIGRDGTPRAAGRHPPRPPLDGTLISQTVFLESARDIGRRRGGVAATRKKRGTSHRIWCQAMRELGIPKGNWVLFSVANFQMFAGWAALQLERQDLNFATAMLNKMGSPRDAWVKEAEILDIKAAYLDRRATDLAQRPVPPEERERVCIADDRLRFFIELGERVAAEDGGWAQADHDRLGVISWILIMTLFCVLASTMRTLLSADDIWFEEKPARPDTGRWCRFDPCASSCVSLSTGERASRPRRGDTSRSDVSDGTRSISRRRLVTGGPEPLASSRRRWIAARSSGTAAGRARPQRGRPPRWTRNSRSSTGSWGTQPGRSSGTPPTVGG